MTTMKAVNSWPKGLWNLLHQTYIYIHKWKWRFHSFETSNSFIEPLFKGLFLALFLTAFQIFLIYSLPVLWRIDTLISWSSMVGRQFLQLHCTSQTIRDTKGWKLCHMTMKRNIYSCLYSSIVWMNKAVLSGVNTNGSNS